MCLTHKSSFASVLNHLLMSGWFFFLCVLLNGIHVEECSQLSLKLKSCVPIKSFEKFVSDVKFVGQADSVNV